MHHKINPPHPKISALFSKRNRFCFINQFPPGFMPARVEFGIKRPASGSNVPLAELSVDMEAMGKEKGLSIRVQREDIFEAMHRI